MKEIKIIIAFLALFSLSLVSCEEDENTGPAFLNVLVENVSEHNFDPIGTLDGSITIQEFTVNGDTLNFELVIPENTTAPQQPSYAFLYQTKLFIEEFDELRTTRGECENCEGLIVTLDEIGQKDKYVSGKFIGTIPSTYPGHPDFELEGTFNVLLDQ